MQLLSLLLFETSAFLLLCNILCLLELSIYPSACMRGIDQGIGSKPKVTLICELLNAGYALHV